MCYFHGMVKCLLVDDDIALGGLLREMFAQQNLGLSVCHSAEDALMVLSREVFDLLILDWDLPHMDGVTLCKHFRDNGGTAYVIFLTGHNDINSKEQALEVGGDDFLSKPFHMRELFARMRSVMRRAPELLTDTLSVNGVGLNTEKRLLIFDGKEAPLTKKEAALLEYLMRHPNRPMTAQKLLTAIWPSETDSSVDTVRTWMLNLREKLEQVGRADLIKTVVRAGYVIEVEN